MATWFEQQVNTLIALGDSPQDAEEFVKQALLWVPPGTAPESYWPTVPDLQSLSVSTAEDIMDARIDWYASDDVPADLKRLLDATLEQA